MGFPLAEAIQVGDFLRLCALSSVIFVLLTGCPGFRWINFILTTWHSAVFWIQNGNNADKTLMFWLLSCIFPKSRTFLCLLLCQWGEAKYFKKKLWGKIGGQWPELAKGTLRPSNAMPSTSAGEAVGRGSSLGFKNGVWHHAVGGKQLCCALLLFL